MLAYKIKAHLQDSVAVGCKYDILQLVAKILKGLDHEAESNILTKIILLDLNRNLLWLFNLLK